MRPPNALPSLPDYPVPGLRGTAPAFIRTGVRFSISLYCCAGYPCQGGGIWLLGILKIRMLANALKWKSNLGSLERATVETTVGKESDI